MTAGRMEARLDDEVPGEETDAVTMRRLLGLSCEFSASV